MNDTAYLHISNAKIQKQLREIFADNPTMPGLHRKIERHKELFYFFLSSLRRLLILKRFVRKNYKKNHFPKLVHIYLILSYYCVNVQTSLEPHICRSRSDFLS